MPLDEPFKADPGHITDFGKRSVADIFNGVIVPAVNSVVELIPPPEPEDDLTEDDPAPPQFQLDKAFSKPKDGDILANLYRSSQQPF